MCDRVNGSGHFRADIYAAVRRRLPGGRCGRGGCGRRAGASAGLGRRHRGGGSRGRPAGGLGHGLYRGTEAARRRGGGRCTTPCRRAAVSAHGRRGGQPAAGSGRPWLQGATRHPRPTPPPHGRPPPRPGAAAATAGASVECPWAVERAGRRGLRPQHARGRCATDRHETVSRPRRRPRGSQICGAAAAHGAALVSHRGVRIGRRPERGYFRDDRFNRRGLLDDLIVWDCSLDTSPHTARTLCTW